MEDKSKDTSRLGKYLEIYMSKFQQETLLSSEKGLGLDIFWPFKFVGAILASIWQIVFGKRG
jgi:hypothetical protein